jgi:hypothetical protein
MEHEGLLPWSQEPTTVLCSETDKSSLHFHTLFP